MSSRFVKILNISQSHLQPGLNRDRLVDILSRHWIVQPINWDRVSEQELEQIAQEIKAVAMAHRTGVL